MVKNPSASTRKYTHSKAKSSSQPPEPVKLCSDNSKEFASSHEELFDNAHSLNDKALGKRPIEENLESLTPKKPKADLTSSLKSNINLWDTPNRDSFISIKEKQIAHDRVVDLNDMEILNCKVKELFDF